MQARCKNRERRQANKTKKLAADRIVGSISANVSFGF
jgi:hypothetical protein